MIAELEKLLRRTADQYNYYLGIAFVDIRTGQVVSLRGEARFHAMSSFKGPLAAYYFWLLERSLIVEQEGDRQHLMEMLEVSANPDTSCIFERVGGIAPFNDWLAEEQGFSRENNFVFKWDGWNCNSDDGSYYIPPTDWRYSRGEPGLGIPDNGDALECPIAELPCDKAFAPVELAEFYARLYRGEVIGPAYRDILLPWMEEGDQESAFLNNLPPGLGVHVFIKGGTQKANEVYRVNFFSEAGIIQTPNGAYALAVFMQNNLQWPGTFAVSEAARITYEYFTTAHPDYAPPP
jgi:hypothetical protein